MDAVNNVMEYKCPCCNAGLVFGEDVQRLTCNYCDNSFDLDTVKAYQESQMDSQAFHWEQDEHTAWSEEECGVIRSFTCPSCSGEIITDETTAATFCPYCDNPTIMPGRVSGGLKPDALIPFKTSKEDAKDAFRKLCKGKLLLPKLFLSEHQIEKITGMYVPFWLYDCSGSLDGSYKATRIHRWSDSRYHYTKTDHFLLKRAADASFIGIPMDGSKKMDDTFMESIEPFDYGEIIDFDTAYLSGFYADKYDVPSESGEDRIRDRVSNALDEQLQSTFLGYATVVPTSKHLNIQHSKARYVLLPVWMLNTRYNDKIYTFAMNGQTGKMTGSFPVCPRKTALWFSGIFMGVTALVCLLQMIGL